MDISSLFAALLKKSITGQKARLRDVTGDFTSVFPVRYDEKISIVGKNVDIKIAGAEKDLSFKLFLPEHTAPEQIHVAYDERNAVFTAAGPPDRQIGILEIRMPRSKEIRLSAENGNILLSAAAADNIHAKANNGDIVVKDIDVKNADIAAHNGNILLKLPPKVYRLDLTADCGDVCKSGIKSRKTSERVIAARAKNGDVTVTANT